MYCRIIIFLSESYLQFDTKISCSFFVTLEIMDQNDKGEEMVHEEVSNIVSDHKSCVDCKTTKTPLWRSGPAGPKSLCNACGIRYRKKRTGTTRVFNKHQEKKKFVEGDDEKGTTNKRRKVSKDLRRRVMSLGKEVVVLQQPRSPMKRQKRKINHYWKKMGEVEQAAVLLMAMSCGSILALDRRIGNQIQGSQSIIP